MKIALISGSAGDTRCGVGDYTWELAQHLALDAEVHLYYDREHGPVSPAYEKLSTLFEHPVGGFSLLVLKAISEDLRAGEFDVVHVQYPSRGYGTSLGPGFIPQQLAGMQSRSRIAVTLHEWTTSHPLRKLVMDQMLSAADGVLTTTEREMETLAAKLKPQQLLMAIPVGNVLGSRAELERIWSPDPDTYAPPSIAGPEEREPLSLFHFGLPTTKGRGLERLLEALALLIRHGIQATLHLGGDFPPAEPAGQKALGVISRLGISDSVIRLGHLPSDQLRAGAERCLLGVFPFDEGYSSKRSSVAAISEFELPLVVGSGSAEEHPFYAPKVQSAEALAELLAELLRGRAQAEWSQQIERQRDYARRFSFTNVAESHISFYERLRKLDR